MISDMHCKKKISGNTMSLRALHSLCMLEKTLIQTYNMQVMEKPANMKKLEAILKFNGLI